MNLTYAQAALKKYFGYEAFRPLQADIIQAVYDKRDALVLMPTGGGKSVCFQIPAITLEGVAVVVSPLIALMKDQAEGLSANDCRFIKQSISNDQIRNVENALIGGLYKIAVRQPGTRVAGFSTLAQTTENYLFAIDEAHCISGATIFGRNTPSCVF